MARAGKPALAVSMLPQIITDEFFNINAGVSDTAIEHIVDELSDYGYSVDHYSNYILAINFQFSNIHNTIQGELRVNRIEKRFEISAVCGADTIFPVWGDWLAIDKFLQMLQQGLR